MTDRNEHSEADDEIYDVQAHSMSADIPFMLGALLSIDDPLLD